MPTTNLNVLSNRLASSMDIEHKKDHTTHNVKGIKITYTSVLETRERGNIFYLITNSKCNYLFTRWQIGKKIKVLKSQSCIIPIV